MDEMGSGRIELGIWSAVELRCDDDDDDVKRIGVKASAIIVVLRL